jgi:hypothetical protein
MRTRTRVRLFAITFPALALLSCKTEDPSALGENQKALAEAVALNMRMEEEIASLRAELEEAKSKASVVEELKMPTLTEIESSLDLEGSRLKEKARQDFPDAKVESYKTWDLNIPSFEKPFSCKASMVISEPSGKIRTLYWLGTADIKGNWTFTPTENLEPAKPATAKPDEAEKNNGRKYDIDPDNDPPVLEPEKPTRPEPPAKPKPKYDIPLDNPVMGPGAR